MRKFGWEPTETIGGGEELTVADKMSFNTRGYGGEK